MQNSENINNEPSSQVSPVKYRSIDIKLRGGVDYKKYKDKLNRLKANVSYNTKKLQTLTPETKKYKAIKEKIDKYNYERFILKLNEVQIEAIKTYCEHNKLPLNLEEERNKILKIKGDDSSPEKIAY